jgi:hypothetical protein
MDFTASSRKAGSPSLLPSVIDDEDIPPECLDEAAALVRAVPGKTDQSAIADRHLNFTPATNFLPALVSRSPSRSCRLRLFSLSRVTKQPPCSRSIHCLRFARSHHLQVARSTPGGLSPRVHRYRVWCTFNLVLLSSVDCVVRQVL